MRIAADTPGDGGTLKYQWYSNNTDENSGGTEISGAVSESFVPPTAEEGTTYYYVVVTNTNNTAPGLKTPVTISKTARVEVTVTNLSAPVISGQPEADTTIQIGKSVTLSVTASVSDKGTISYHQDTVVSTGFKSTALITVGSTVLTVRPLTRLTLTEIRASSGSETLNVNLQTVRVRIDVKLPVGSKASMKVSNPTTTASVRGTSFELDTQNLYVISGNVSFKGIRGSAIFVTTGANSSTDQNGSAENPLALGEDAYKPQLPVGTQPNAKPASIVEGSGGSVGITVDFK